MRQHGIERKTLFVTLLPMLAMAVFLEGFFIFTRFSDLEHSLMERSQLLARQLASSVEYAMFSGNAILLKQNVDAALLFQDVTSVSIFDENEKMVLESGSGAVKTYSNPLYPLLPVYQDGDVLRLYEPVMATQINLDGLISSPATANKLGAVLIEISKKRLNREKHEYLLFSLLFTVLVCIVALILALRNARSITGPILQMHQVIRRIAGGELEATIHSQCNIRELHELANGFNDMALQLLRNRDLLENRILETTDNLRMKNAEIEQANLEKERLNENLALALGELQAIMEANPDILYVLNMQGGLIQWNSSLAKFCGLPPENMLSRYLVDFMQKEDSERGKKWINEVFAKGAASVEVNFVRHDGELVPYLCNGVILKNPAGEMIGFTGTGRDISERKQAAEHLHHMAHYDILTDLPNRSLLSDRLQQAIIANKREHGHLALMFLDLDMFKYVNDNLGHDIGDLLLKEVARRILECLRESDTAARIGGDEFVVLLPSVESIQTALLVADKIRSALCQPFEIYGHNLNISSSIGVAVYPEHGTDEKILLKNADTAMYQAKRNGRNIVVLYSS